MFKEQRKEAAGGAVDRPRALVDRAFITRSSKPPEDVSRALMRSPVCALKVNLGFWVQNGREQGSGGETGSQSELSQLLKWMGVVRCAVEAEDILEVKAGRWWPGLWPEQQ